MHTMDLASYIFYILDFDKKIYTFKIIFVSKHMFNNT
jgi:hypothetical protein